MMNQCKVVFWDVQHGHATYIKTPNNRHIVIDLGTGNYSSGNQKFSPLEYIKKYFTDQLDQVIITHPHLDHIDDILNFDLLSPNIFFRPKHLSNDEVMQGVNNNHREKFEKYCEINDRYNNPVQGGSKDDLDNPLHWGGVKISTFMPSQCDHSNFNNHSIVTVLEYSGIKIVIPGDNEKCSFDELFKQYGFIAAISDADVLLAPHHGRNSGFDSTFVNYVSPKLTVVSDGSYCDSSANSRYSDKSTGWKVHNRVTGESRDRKCLTTNSDGEVEVIFGPSDDPKHIGNLDIGINCGYNFT